MLDVLYSLLLKRHNGRGRRWKLKMAYQRAKFGYCREDVWSVDHFLGMVIPPMLRELKDSGVGSGYWDRGEFIHFDGMGNAASSEYDLRAAQKQWDEMLDEFASEWGKLTDDHWLKKGPDHEVDSTVLHKFIDNLGQFWC